MSVFKCKMCGGTLELSRDETVGICEYCGTRQTLPKLGDEQKANLYERANHLRRNNEYDKAMGIYEEILNKDSTDAESYWSLVLCRYGIEYVEDPATHKRVPTVNRAQFTSVFADEDYKSAIEHADGAQREIYEHEAKMIDEIQKGILAISQKEKPFDVFICYKETDANGRRTPDSVLATDLYHQLKQEGFNVFFSRITLEDKLGVEYEPYIFAALNSAKVMVVLGTKPEYFNAVWVKNEWSRYLALIKNGAKKMLIPAYRDMDPYNIPEEFSHLQAQDMSKLGFMQDLIRGIKKIVSSETATPAVMETVVVSGTANTNAAPLLRRVFIFLEDGDFANADEYCEKVLDMEPENAEAYLGKMMAELRVRKREDLALFDEPFDGNANYKRALRFADEAFAEELRGYVSSINERKENERFEKVYAQGIAAIKSAKTENDFIQAAKYFDNIAKHKNSAVLAADCRRKAEEIAKGTKYNEAENLLKKGDLKSIKKAKAIYESLSGWKDSAEKIAICDEKVLDAVHREETAKIRKERKAEDRKGVAKIAIPVIAGVLAAAILGVFVFSPVLDYNKAVKLIESEDYEAAGAAFAEMADYKDSAALLTECDYQIAMDLMEAGEYEKAAEAFSALGGYEKAKENHKECSYNIASALFTEEKFEEAKIAFASLSGYKDSDKKAAECEKGIKYLSAVELFEAKNYMGAAKIFSEMKDFKDSGEYFTETIKTINARTKTIFAGSYTTAALKEDGTVVACGENNWGQTNVSHYKDVKELSLCDYWGEHMVGIRSDGTVVSSGCNLLEQRNIISKWTDIVTILANMDSTIGLKPDGTVVAAGWNRDGNCNVSQWRDIVEIDGGDFFTVGLKADGTVVATGNNYNGQCNVSGWTDIVAIACGFKSTIGLKFDGKVVATGDNTFGQCNVSDWTDIVAVFASGTHTIGLKSDGTVVATGHNEKGACNVSNWTDIVAVEGNDGYPFTVGLKADGTVVATGDNTSGQCNVSDWTDIVAVACGSQYTIGLKSDGTVVATGDNSYGQCNVSDWTDIKLPEIYR